MKNHPVERWHQYMKGELEGGLDDLLHDDCVFLSPVVFTPQKGKELTKLYLMAAGGSFGEGDADKAPGGSESKFRYVKEVIDGQHAIAFVNPVTSRRPALEVRTVVERDPAVAVRGGVFDLANPQVAPRDLERSAIPHTVNLETNEAFFGF